MIILTRQNYWKELETSNLPAVVKDCLKGLINSHIHNTIPPQWKAREAPAIVEAEAEVIILQDDKKSETLAVMHFIPADPETHREFLYLSKNQVKGTD